MQTQRSSKTDKNFLGVGWVFVEKFGFYKHFPIQKGIFFNLKIVEAWVAIFIFSVPARIMKRERFALAGVPLLTSSAHNLFIPCSAQLCSSTILSLIAHTPYGEGRGKKSLLFVRFWWKIAHICKIENKLGNGQELFFHFLHRKRVIHKKNVKKGVRGHDPNGRMAYTVNNYINRSSVFVLYKVTECFFFISYYFSSFKILFRKINFCLKNWNFRRRIFFRNRKFEKKIL